MKHASIALAAACGLVLAVVASVVSAQGGTLPPLPKDAKVNITFYNYNLASAGIGAEGTKQLIAELYDSKLQLPWKIKQLAAGRPSGWQIDPLAAKAAQIE